MHTDLLEEEARQEEEYRRLSEALAEDGIYNAVGFAYNSDYYDPSQPTEEEELAKTDVESDDNAEENEEPYTAPPGLLVPSDVEVPATSKMHAIIERTAKFVCKQGTPFEIMLKAKQARNSQFDFLRFDHYLNPYYKHILKTMKEGKYVAQPEKRFEEKRKSVTESGDDDDDDNDGCYLHPSLFASKSNSRLEELTRPLKIMDPDHPLAALVRKVQADAKNLQKQQESDSSEAVAATVEYAADSAVTTMYYGYYMMPDGTYCLTPPPPGMEVAGYYSTVPSEMAVPTTTGVSAPPPPGTTPPPPPEGDSSNIQVPSTTTTVSAPTVVPVIIPPPPDIQPVIDKLAEYVARNGTKFETSVRDKNDTRFEFLQPWHQYNAYYEFKKQYFSQKEGCSIPQETVASSTLSICSESNTTDILQFEVQQEVTSTSGSSAMITQTDCTSSTDKPVNDGKLIKASFAPISFAIKAKENDMLPLEKKRVKLDDDSDEDQDVQDMSNNDSTKDVTSSLPPEEKKPQLTAEEIEAKHAKQKLEDRLAAAAREKLAQASKECKERQLQAERKKRAALFLQNLKTPTPSGDLETAATEESSQHIQIDNTEVFSAKFHQRLIAKISADAGRHSAHLVHPSIETCRPPNTASNCLLNDSRVYASATLPRRSIQAASETSHKIASATEAKTSHQVSTKSVRTSKEKEKEKKKEKKHRKKSRSRSRSRPRYRLRSRTRSRSRSRSKAKHSLPSAYRSVRHSRSRSPHGRRVQSSERRREERERDRNVPSAYRVGNSSGISSRKRSRSPYEKKKKKSSKSHPKLKGKALRSRSRSLSPKKSSIKSSAHSTSLSPAESRDSSQEHSRGCSQEKDGTASPELLSSMQSKITQDLMAKVRAMLAASKDVQTNVS